MDLSENRLESKKNVFKNRLLLKRILAYKYLFLVSVILCLFLAYLYNTYTPPIYMVKTSVMVKESDTRNPDIRELLSEQKLGVQGTEKNLADEIALLKSYPFI